MILLHFTSEDQELIASVAVHLHRAGLADWLRLFEAQDWDALVAALETIDAATVLIVPWSQSNAARLSAALYPRGQQELLVIALAIGRPATPAWVSPVDMSDRQAGLVQLSDLLIRELLIGACRPASPLCAVNGSLRDATWSEVRQVARRCLDIDLLEDFLDWSEEGPLSGDGLAERRAVLLNRLVSQEERERFADFLEGERPECTQRSLEAVRRRGPWVLKPLVAPATERRLFVSFAAGDQDYLRELEAQLLVLGRTQPLQVCHRGRVLAGDKTAQVAAWLDEANVVLVLLSAEYLADDELYAELTRALRHRREGRIQLAPILVRAVHATPIVDGLLILPRGGPPVAEWRSRDGAWTQVIGEIARWFAAE